MFGPLFSPAALMAAAARKAAAKGGKAAHRAAGRRSRGGGWDGQAPPSGNRRRGSNPWAPSTATPATEPTEPTDPYGNALPDPSDPYAALAAQQQQLAAEQLAQQQVLAMQAQRYAQAPDPFDSFQTRSELESAFENAGLMGLLHERAHAASEPAPPRWGQSPYRERLPKLMKRAARQVVENLVPGHQGVEVLIVALMPDGNFDIRAGSRETLPRVAELARTALAVRAFDGDGKLLTEGYSPDLMHAEVPTWLRK